MLSDSYGTLLALRPSPTETIFPDHLVDKRFLDADGFIDLEKMFLEMGGTSRHESDDKSNSHEQQPNLSTSSQYYEMRDGSGDGRRQQPKVYDQSDPQIIQKVFNRRPKEILTPDQIANLTSVTIGNRPATIDQTQQKPPWVDDYRHRDLRDLPVTPISSLPYHHKNPYISGEEQFQTPAQPPLFWIKNHQYNRQLPPRHCYQTPPDTLQQQSPVSIVQRLHDAAAFRQQQLNDQAHLRSPSVYSTPFSPVLQQQFSPLINDKESANTFNWPFIEQSTLVKPSVDSNVYHPHRFGSIGSTNPMQTAYRTHSTVKQNQKILSDLINNHQQVQQSFPTPPSLTAGNGNDDEDDQSFYSAMPSPTTECDQALSNVLDSGHDLYNDCQPNSDHIRIYHQAVLVNSLLRNALTDQKSNDTSSSIGTQIQEESPSPQKQQQKNRVQDVLRTSSDESCFSTNTTDSQNMLQYLKPLHLSQRHEMLEQVTSMSPADQSSFKRILQDMILEQLEVMKSQQHLQQGDPSQQQRDHSVSSQMSAANQCHSIPSLHPESVFSDHYDRHGSPLDRWFDRDIYSRNLPQMPMPASGQRVFSATDLEQSRRSSRLNPNNNQIPTSFYHRI
ncbi:unnamed protein product [Didymodactylos carnosus]|uniref:Uncharacterized protein n=1 Tax=Didymodactylos carnosus TaxID=1234261 RepID=A0A813Y9G7_9BILA|nr:unnamed protein product [Didymodactylos carnosus]CAF1033988.1 unnamed protein product [Didymodactylos carnosus]CAF3667178.1 unnamed protein product [Didymodactylos carnosus]CAF3802264.1 unnamed protein product [Didymodactylos carnosus]